jgi:hypothetical protein
MAHYRFIVSRQHQTLFDHLVRSLADMDDIEVILDRRAGAADKRPRGQAERRMHARVHEELATFGWAFIRISRPGRGLPQPTRSGGG